MRAREFLTTPPQASGCGIKSWVKVFSSSEKAFFQVSGDYSVQSTAVPLAPPLSFLHSFLDFLPASASSSLMDFLSGTCDRRRLQQLCRTHSRHPKHILAGCKRLTGGGVTADFRERRAFEAGYWARLTLAGCVPKPRSTQALNLQRKVYIILKARGLESATSVANASNLYRLTGRLGQ